MFLTKINIFHEQSTHYDLQNKRNQNDSRSSPIQKPTTIFTLHKHLLKYTYMRCPACIANLCMWAPVNVCARTCLCKICVVVEELLVKYMIRVFLEGLVSLHTPSTNSFLGLVKGMSSTLKPGD